MSSTDSGATLRAEFDKEATLKCRKDTLIGSVAAAVAFPLFGFLDPVVYPDHLVELLSIRLGVVILSGVIYVLARTPLGTRRPFDLAMIEYVIAGLGIAVMIHITEGYLSPYYAGINLILICFVAVMPLDPRRTALVCTIIYSAYIGPILLSAGVQDWAVFANNNFFMLATVVLVILSAHFSTSLRFKEFASRYNLAEANEEMKKLDVLKSQFFANVSHEVRTPLTSIISPVQSLYHGEVGELTAHQHDLVEQVYRNSLRLLDMINQMLDFAKFDARKMQLRLSRVELEDVVQDAVTVFSEVCQRKNLRLQYLADGPIPSVYLDQDKVERILSNLIRNAIKFTERGSVIIRLRAQKDAIVLEVEDTGIGIPPESLPWIFDRFRQVDGSSTRRYEGTGLGLTIVREAVELQRGTITVVSEVNAGTRFTVTLPTDLDERSPEAFIERRQQDRRTDSRPHSGPDRRKGARRFRDVTALGFEDIAFVESPRAEAVHDPVSSEEAAHQGYRVLYAEDNQDLRSYVANMLQSFGHEVETAVDGVDAWAKIQTWEPDIVVSDVMMPHMDGYELLTRIKETASTRRIPVVLTTAKSELDSRIEGLRIGADDYLAKPINMRELDARIENLITAGKFRDAVAKTAELEERVKQLSLGFSESLALRDHYTAGHSHSVLRYGEIIAEELKISMDRVLTDSLLLHDIGKLGVPDSILLKTGRLTADEWETMKQHAELGASLLRRFDAFRPVSEIVWAHQEHFDGTGYPRGLAREDIPRYARIIAVADGWHAMTEDRPYRRALSHDAAIRELISQRGRQFDPEIVDAFLNGMIRHGRLDTAQVAAASTRR